MLSAKIRTHCQQSLSHRVVLFYTTWSLTLQHYDCCELWCDQCWTAENSRRWFENNHSHRPPPTLSRQQQSVRPQSCTAFILHESAHSKWNSSYRPWRHVEARPEDKGEQFGSTNQPLEEIPNSWIPGKHHLLTERKLDEDVALQLNSFNNLKCFTRDWHH